MAQVDQVTFSYNFFGVGDRRNFYALGMSRGRGLDFENITLAVTMKYGDDFLLDDERKRLYLKAMDIAEFLGVPLIDEDYDY